MDAAAGTLVNEAASHQEGADLVVATALGAGHQFTTFDVSSRLRATPHGTTEVASGLDAGAVARSYVKVAVSDLDLDGTDEVAVAETRLNAVPTAATTSAAISGSVVTSISLDESSG